MARYLILLAAAGFCAISCTSAKDEPKQARQAAPALHVVPVTTSSDVSRKAFEMGRELVDNFRFSEAIQQFQKALQLDPGFALAHSYMSMISKGPERADHERRAVAASERLSEPERLYVRLNIARACEDMAEAHGLLRRLADLAPDDWRVQSRLGWSAFQDDRWEEAGAALRKAIDLNPKAGEPHNLLGYALAHQGLFQEAIHSIERYAAMKPDEPNPQDSLGEILLLAGRLDEAEAAFRRAAARLPSFWLSWVGVAVSRFSRRDWAAGREALVQARQAATLPGEKLSVDQMLATLMAIEGKSAEALRAMEAVERGAQETRLDDVRAFLPITRAWYLYDLGRGESALHELRRAVELAQKAQLLPHRRTRHELEVHLAHALIAARLGRIAEAEKEVVSVRDLSPKVTDPMARDSLNLGLGALAAAKGDQNAAIRHLSRCRSESTHCLAFLALTQARLGDTAGALETRARVRQSVRRDLSYIYFREKLERANLGAAPPK
jgi:tetratricopeptide (TPR) repeat protein